MAKIQRYQRGQFAGVQIPQTDFASLRQATTTYGAIGEMFGQMADFVNKKAEQQAIERGTRRVADVGAQQTLQQIKAQGGPANVEERQAYAVANKMAVSQLEVSAINEMNTFIEQARMDKLSVNEVKVELEAIKNGYEGAMADLDPESSMVLGQKLISTGLTKLNNYNSYINDLQIADIKQSMENAVATQNLEYVERAQSTGILDIEGLRETYLDIGYEPTQADALVIKYAPSMEQEALRYQYNQLPDYESKKAFKETILKSKYLTPTQERNLIDSLERDTSSELNQQQDTAISAIDNAFDQARITGEAYKQPYSNEQAKVIFANNPEGYEVWSAQNKVYMEVSDTISAFPSMTEKQMLDSVQNAQEKLTSTDPKNVVEYQKNLQIFNALRDAQIKSVEVRNTDPAQAVINSDPILAKQADAATRNILSGQEGLSFLSLTTYLSAQDQKQEMMGISQQNRRYLSNNQAKSLAAYLNESAVANQEFMPTLLQSMINAAGKYDGHLVAELEKAGLNPDYVVALRHADDVEAMADIMMLSMSTQDSLKEGMSSADLTAVKDAIESFRGEIKSYNQVFAIGSRDLNKVNEAILRDQNVAEKNIIQLMKQGHGASDAVTKTLNRFYNFEVHQEDKVQAIGPKGTAYHATLLRQSLDSLVDDERGRNVIGMLDAKPSETYMNEARRLAQQQTGEMYGDNVDRVAMSIYMADLREDGYWVNNNTGDGYLLLKDGQIVYNSKDEPVEIKFDAVDRLYSSIYQGTGGTLEGFRKAYD